MVKFLGSCLLNLSTNLYQSSQQPSRDAKSGRGDYFPWIEQVKAATGSYAKNETYLVGVSGGLDSRVLLHVLLLIGFKRLVVCHLNHNLRGLESSEDSRFVQRLCRCLNLTCHTEKLVKLPDADSLESSARVARWEFYARAARKFDTRNIFLGHHADDQIETFLFNLFRGSASLGNAVMKPESRIEINQQKLVLLRPFLQIPKEDLRLLATKCQLTFREDSTNRSRKMTRNRIRHDLIPTIETVLGRSIRKILLRTVEVASGEADFIRSHVPALADDAELRVHEVRQLPLAIQRLVIHDWLRKQQIKQCGFKKVELVRSLLDRTEIAKVNLPGGAFCRRRSGVLFIEPPLSAVGDRD